MIRAKILKLALKKANKKNNIFPSIVFTDGGGRVKNEQFYKGIIFSHDFAKAFFGESTDTLIVQNNCLNVKQVIDMNGWRYHLQQMVLEEDPVKYLEKFL